MLAKFMMIVSMVGTFLSGISAGICLCHLFASPEYHDILCALLVVACAFGATLAYFSAVAYHDIMKAKEESDKEDVG